MKRTVLGILLGAGLVTAAIALAQQHGEFRTAAAMPAPAAGSEMIVVPASLGDKGQQLTVVDPRQRVICVYHIDMAGTIALKSARNIQWDLQYEAFNTVIPLPNEIKSALEQKQR
jgi:hypothetical protein